MKDYLPERTPSEWKKANAELERKALSDLTKQWQGYAEKYLASRGLDFAIERKVAGFMVGALSKALNLPAEAARWTVGLGDTAGAELGLWESDLHKEFRYHNRPLFQGYATYLNEGLKALTKDRNRTMRFLAKDPVATQEIAMEAFNGWDRERLGDFPWAREHKEAVEEISLRTLDPMWAASYAVGAARVGLLKKEMEYLVPIVKNLMEHSGKITPDFLLEASKLHGGDVVNPTFKLMVRDLTKAGKSAESIALRLWTYQYRASPWSLGLEEIPGGKFFKRAGQLVSGDISDLAVAKEYVQQALMHDRVRAFERIGKLDWLNGYGETVDQFLGRRSEADLIQELWEKVPREPWAVGATFEANYLKMAHEGKVPVVPQSTFEKARKGVEEMRLGWQEGMEWKPTYSPAASTVRKIEDIEDIPMAHPGAVGRYWEEARVGGPGRFKAAADVQSWLAGVSTRLKRADMIDQFVVEANRYKAALKDNILKANVKLVPADDSLVIKAGDIPGFKKLETRRQKLIDGIAAYTEDMHDVVMADRAAGEMGVNPEVTHLRGEIDNLYKELASVEAEQARFPEYYRGMNNAVESQTTYTVDRQATAALRWKFRAQIRMVNSLVRELKLWKTTPDYVRAAKEAEKYPGGAIIAPIFKAYDKLLNVTRTGQILASPSVILNNTINSNVVKNAAETGKVDAAALWEVVRTGKVRPAYDIDGNLLDFAGTPSAGIVGDVGEDTLLGSRSLAKVRDAMAEVLDGTETAARTALGQTVYDLNVTSMLKDGVGREVAHSRALDLAKKAVAKVHFDYGTQSSFDKVARRVWMYPVFNLRNNAWLAEKAVKYPSEFYTIVRLREQQRNHSVDRAGALEVPGFDYAADPFTRATGVAHVLDALLDPAKTLTPQQKQVYAYGKALQLTMGSFTPPVEMALGAMGVLPEKSGGAFSSFETVLSQLSKTLTGEDVYPSDWAYNIVGKDPKESRQSFLDRRAALVGIAARREGYDLTPQQAFDLAEHYDNVVKTASWMGLKLEPAAKGLKSVVPALKDAQWHLVNGDHEFIDGRKQLILATPEFSDLGPVLPLTPAESLRASATRSGKLELAAWSDRAVVGPLAERAEQEERQEKGETLMKALGTSPKLAPFRWLAETLVGRAGAETPAESSQEAKLPWRMTSAGSIALDIPANSSRAERERYYAAEKQVQFLNNVFLSEMLSPAGPKTSEQIAAYVNNIKDEQGNNFAPDLLFQLRTHPKIAPIYQNYLAGTTDEREGNASIAPQQVVESRRNFASGFREWVRAGGKNAPARLNASLDDVRGAMERGEIYTAGMQPVDVDRIALRLAKRDAAGAALSGVRDADDKLRQDYPDFGRVVGDLQDASRNPVRMEKVLREVSQLTGSGRLPADFWSQLDTLPQYRNLYDNVGVAASFPEAKSIMDRLIQRDRSGRPVNVNTAALFETAFNPRFERLKPYVEAARAGYYGAEFQNLINRHIDNLPGAYREVVDERLAPDAARIQDHFREETNLATGNLSPGFRELLGMLSGSETAVKAPLVPNSPLKSTQRVEAPGGIARPDEPVTPLLPVTVEQVAKDLPGSYTPGWFEGRSSFRAAPMRFGQIVNEALGEYSFHKNAQASFERYGSWQDRDGRVQTFAPPEPSLATSFGTMMGDAIASGSTLQNVQMAGEIANVINASAQGPYRSLTETGDIKPTQDSNAAMHGLNMWASTFTDPAQMTANMATLGAYGVYVGVKSGLNFGKKGAQQREAQARQAQAAREAGDRFAEQMRQQQIRTNVERERTIVQSLQQGGRVAEIAARTQPQLARFQRRGTFASKLGLVDAVERELASALKPRW